ncbi:MAG TPA: hypothetical protein VN065_00560 [Bradyrhizobium sp.]|jgi:hypothetical protein|nr:hypothetical protein [Bradyrhizobium sp.]
MLGNCISRGSRFAISALFALALSSAEFLVTGGGRADAKTYDLTNPKELSEFDSLVHGTIKYQPHYVCFGTLVRDYVKLLESFKSQVEGLVGGNDALRAQIDRLDADISAEIAKMKALPPCGKRAQAPLPPTEFPFGPNGPYETASFEFSGYGGSVAASSFGSDFNPDVWGGRAVARIPVGAVRLQADVEGERTSDYSSIAGNRSYFAGGAHADWMVAPTTEIGGFGALQDAKPTFSGPTSTNYVIGLEGRKFFGPAMFGAQFGRFDVVNGPGTLTNAWFVEGRAKFSVGEAFHVPALKYTIIGGELGYGSGTASVATIGAQTTYWGLGLTQGFANTPVRLSLKYDHFENRVDGLGLVWKENKFMGGLKFLLPNTDVSRGRIEPTVPLPYILRTVMTF